MKPLDEQLLAYTAQQSGERLDAFLARESGQSRARVQKLIEEGCALVNGAHCKPNHRLREGETVQLCLPPLQQHLLHAEELPLDIIYQDSDICVINKPQGMVVHPAPGNETGTLVHALLFSLDSLSSVGDPMRPGIVHRIDKLTSGLLVVAKNDTAHEALCAQLKTHAIQRQYIAIVEGNLKEDMGTIDAPIARHPIDRKRMAVVQGGREAVTHWRVLFRMGQFTLLAASLVTGRTHQIRVHMASCGHPVAGDTVYGPSKPKLGLAGQALHAYCLTLMHPRTGEKMTFCAPPPAYFLAALRRAGWDGCPYWNEKAE